MHAAATQLESYRSCVDMEVYPDLPSFVHVFACVNELATQRKPSVTGISFSLISRTRSFGRPLRFHQTKPRWSKIDLYLEYYAVVD